jgi:LEA14-like dessication related protein
MKSSRVRDVALFLLVLALPGCPNPKKTLDEVVKPPSVQVKNVTLAGISLEKLDFLVELEIANPNPVSFTVSKVDYNLALSGQSLMSGQLQPNVQIKASGVTPAQVTVSVGFREVAAIFQAALGQDAVPKSLTRNVHILSLLNIRRCPR